MNCPHCSFAKVAARSRLTRHGYKTFWCKNCRRTFNERTGTPFNRRQLQTGVLFKVVLWRLRYKLSLSDLAEMFSLEEEGFYFARETIRRWQEKFAPLIADQLQVERKGQCDKRWKIDETLVKVDQRFHYLYRAIDSQGKLVATRLSLGRTLESTCAFLKQAVTMVGHLPQQITTDKEASYPGAIEKAVGRKVEHRTDRYRNNRLEQDHRGIKGRYKVLKGFKKFDSAAGFCVAYDEQRDYFKWRRWHNDWHTSGIKRADFKAKFYGLKAKFMSSQLVWQQAVMIGV